MANPCSKNLGMRKSWQWPIYWFNPKRFPKRIGPKHWAMRLSAAKAAGNPDDTETYFRAALTALEQLLISGQKVSSQELTVRLDEWEHAHLRTPHGQPVVLNQS